MYLDKIRWSQVDVMVVVMMVYLHCPTILARQSEVRLKLAKKEEEV